MKIKYSKQVKRILSGPFNEHSIRFETKDLAAVLWWSRFGFTYISHIYIGPVNFNRHLRITTKDIYYKAERYFTRKKA